MSESVASIPLVRTRSIRLTVTSAVLLLLQASCGGREAQPSAPPDPVPTNPIPAIIRVAPDSSRLSSLGDTIVLRATVSDASGREMNNVVPTWHSTTTAVASVSGSGVVTALANGVATIDVAVGTLRASARVVVGQRPATLRVAADSMRLHALRDTVTLHATASDANGHVIANATTTWISLAPEIASITPGGLVTALANGDAVFRVNAGSTLSAEVRLRVAQRGTRLAVLSQPLGAMAGVAFRAQPIVQLVDRNGYPVRGSDSVRIAASLVLVDGARTAVLVGSTAQSMAEGLARFANLRVDGAVGTYRLRFTSTGLIETLTEAFLLEPGAPESLTPAKPVSALMIAGTTIDTVMVLVTDRFGNAVSGSPVRWRVTTGNGSVRPLTDVTDINGHARATWTVGVELDVQNQLEASLGPSESALRAQFATRTDAPMAPLRFRDDTDWVSPTRHATIRVIDARGLVVPPRLVTYRVDNYSGGNPPAAFSVDSNGVVSFTSIGDRRTWSFRIRAQTALAPVRGLMLLVAHSVPADRVIVATEHWRLVLPRKWIADLDATVPDWRTAFDVGWLGQKELMGMTLEEANNAAIPNNPLLPQSSGTDDEVVCGLSSLPLTFGAPCFAFPNGAYGNHPRWFIIFHELGHQSTLAQQGRAVFYNARGSTFLESDASLLSLWSSYRMMNSSRLSASARTSVAGTFHEDTARFSVALRRWGESTQAWTDHNEPNGFNADMLNGIHAQLIRDYGWDWVPRYARTFRNDPFVCATLRGNANCFAVPDNSTPTQRATFAAAALSAAVRADLRPRLLSWRFPSDAALFQTLRSHLETAVDRGW